jgi:hypothetical protein
MKRLAFTQHTMRCPLDGGTASVTVRTDPDGYPSRRYRAVTACSLLPSTSFVPPARRGYFSDVAPPVAYLCEVDPSRRHSVEVACPKPCLATLNAAEPGARPLRCTSGVNDALELARQIQSPAIMRVLWSYSG